MHIRVRKWAKEELDNSGFFTRTPFEFKGKWQTKFKNFQPIYLELGCGKGKFISNLAKQNPNKNCVGIDLIDSILGLAKREIEKEFDNENINNIFLIRYNIENIIDIFSKQDNVERIYINFCNPWPKIRHNKHRLTHTLQLEKYKTFLQTGAQIFFKTDNEELFNDSIQYFNESGFSILKQTRDLQADDIFTNNIKTEHEIMFINQGIKIKGLIAVKNQ